MHFICTSPQTDEPWLQGDGQEFIGLHQQHQVVVHHLIQSLMYVKYTLLGRGGLVIYVRTEDKAQGVTLYPR